MGLICVDLLRCLLLPAHIASHRMESRFASNPHLQLPRIHGNCLEKNKIEKHIFLLQLITLIALHAWLSMTTILDDPYSGNLLHDINLEEVTKQNTFQMRFF